MGYRATGCGKVKIKADLTDKELAKIYPAGEEPGTLMIGGVDVQISCVEDLINAIADADEAFEAISFEASESTEKVHTLSFEHQDKYSSTLVKDTLSMFAPITLEGRIDFIGEDNDMWCFHFEKGEFVAYSGCVAFECENPECSNSCCAYCGNGRCHAAAVRSEYRSMIKVDPLTNVVIDSDCPCFVRDNT